MITIHTCADDDVTAMNSKQRARCTSDVRAFAQARQAKISINNTASVSTDITIQSSVVHRAS